VVVLERWDQIDGLRPEQWLLVNFEALKESAPTEIDPRSEGEPLWSERHSAKLLVDRRTLDPRQFQSLYQGKPSNAEGLLYGEGFSTYSSLPDDIIRRGNYTDTADTGDDHLCSVCYALDGAGTIYVTDVVYSRERMEVTEKLVAEMLSQYHSCEVLVESNNGGRGFARAISRLQPHLSVKWFHQSSNKEARILSNASAVLRNIVMPADWHRRWLEFASHLTSYHRSIRVNRWHDAPDVVTGIVEREYSDSFSKKIRAMTFSR
jgi:predicted phage terminase large subunit-like protein